MKTRALGPYRVSAVGLGAMPLSLSGRPGEAEAIRVIHAALDAGVTLIDTADVYCLDQRDIGHNERLIARALRERPASAAVVATKGGLERPGGTWVSNGRPAHLRAACEASLRALGVETIALYQLHGPDDNVPFEESVGALAELRREGKIRELGLSNVSADEIARARRIAPVVSVQNRANVFDRRSWQGGVLAACEQHGMALLAYGPVGGHHGKVRVAESQPLVELGARRGVSPYQVALAWLLAKSEAIIPIPGATRTQSIRDSAVAPELELAQEDLAALDALAA